MTCLHTSLPAVPNVRVYENYIRCSLKYRFLDHSAIICVNIFGVFQVAMYRCESWTIKKAEHWRIDAFELWCWKRLLRVPQTARRSNQSILREIILNTCWKDWYWSWNSSILVIWGEQLTHWKSPWCWERLRAGGGGGDNRGWDGWMASPTKQTWVWANSGR